VIVIKKILIPLDGSPAAEVVLPAAAALAAITSAGICLIHILEKNAPAQRHWQKHLTVAQDALEYLDTVANRFFPSQPTIEKHVHEVLVEDIAESIVHHAGELATDLVMLTLHGNHGARDLFRGSLAQQVVGKGGIPVFLRRGRNNTADHGRSYSVERILVPLDRNESHAGGLQWALDLAQAARAGIHLLVVVDTFASISGGAIPISRLLPGSTRHLLDLEQDDIAAELAQKVDRITKLGIAVEWSTARGETAAVIGQVARTIDASMIAVGTHGARGTAAFWAGSVAARLGQQCDIPLLLIPEKQTLQ
jgi:nucleotide-binding universal stress UspA family protein